MANGDSYKRDRNSCSKVKNFDKGNGMTSLESSSNSGSKTKMCVVCMKRNVSYIIIPCGHIFLYNVCSTENFLDRMNHRCPECRSDVREVMKVFGRIVDDD